MNIQRFLILFSALLLAGCSDSFVPKPRGYFRIAFPEHTYTQYDAPCGTSMEIPTFSKIEIRKSEQDSCWYNIVFPQFKARVHCTYLKVDGSVTPYVEDAYNFAFKHEMKANAIRRTEFLSDSAGTFGTLYHLTGDVASPLQFFVSDSTNHFLRGSVYFSSAVNADSLEPVVAYIKEDLEHLMQTTRWH